MMAQFTAIKEVFLPKIQEKQISAEISTKKSNLWSRPQQNKKVEDLFSKLSNDKINITKINTPTKNIYEEKTVSEDLTKESKLKKEKIARKLGPQLIVVGKKYKELFTKIILAKHRHQQASQITFLLPKKCGKHK